MVNQKKKIKIAQVCHSFLPKIGGIEMYVYRIVRDLPKDRFEHQVFTASAKKEGRIKKIKATYLRSFNLLPRNPFLFGLREKLENFNPDVVHIHSIWFLASLQACLLKKRLNYRIINTVHGVAPDKKSFLISLFTFLFKPFAQYIISKSDTIIVLSEAEKAKLLLFFNAEEEKVSIIPTGIDLVNSKKREVERVRQKIGDSYLLFSGRIIPDKNPDVLIRAFAELKPNFKLVFVGPIEKNYKAKLTTLEPNLKSRIIFYGALDPIQKEKELAALYKEATLSIAIGSWEGLPARVIESMAQKTPCIVYASGGSRDLIKNSVNGYLLEKLDSNSLATLINSYLASENKNKIKKNCLLTVSNYLWTNKFNEIIKLYKCPEENFSVDFFLPRRMGGSVKWGLDLAFSLGRKGIKTKVWRGELEVLKGLFLAKGAIIHTAVPLPFIKPGKKMVLTIHGILSKEKNIWNRFMPFTIKRANAITVPSNFLRSELKLKKEVQVISNPINIVEFPKAEIKNIKNNFTLMTVTNFNYYNKCSGLLEIVKGLNNLTKVHDFKLIILGDGKYFEEIKNRTQQDAKFKTVFKGFVDPKKFYRQTDVFLYYSGQDNAPIAVLEAMASGLPVISNNVGNISEVIRDKKNGLIVENAAELTLELEKLLVDIKTRKKIATEGAKTALENDSHKIAELFIDLYQKII